MNQLSNQNANQHRRASLKRLVLYKKIHCRVVPTVAIYLQVYSAKDMFLCLLYITTMPKTYTSY